MGEKLRGLNVVNRDANGGGPGDLVSAEHNAFAKTVVDETLQVCVELAPCNLPVYQTYIDIDLRMTAKQGDYAVCERVTGMHDIKPQPRIFQRDFLQ